MRVARVDVTNFRAASRVAVDLEALTCIIGENNSGKSTVLKAIDLFFQNGPRVEEDDFHNKNIKEPIEITLTLVDLVPSEMELFKANLIEDKLIVTRRFIHGNPSDSGSFSVEAMVNPEFAACRNEGSKSQRRDEYRKLQTKYSDLPNVSNADQIDEHLEAWENLNPGNLKRQRVGSFRGWKNVAIGQLKARTDFISVPAVRDAAADAGEAKSPAKQLIDALAKQTIENNKSFQEFKAETNEKLRQLTDPANVPALAEMSGTLSTILQQYYSDAALIASWAPISEMPIQYPSSHISVRDHDFDSTVDRVGHGLQRAIIITILEFLARQKVQLNGETIQEFDLPQSDLIVAIEEPEIYQHPTKQRHLSKVLCELAGTFSKQTGIRIQIIMATHSPLFVHLPRFGEIRITRRDAKDGNRVVVSYLTLAECSQALAAYFDPPKQPMGDAAFAARLHIFTSEISEGFFAKKVVLVEGVSDKAIIEAAFAISNRSCAAEGIAVIEVGGKTKIDKPCHIFRTLGIPTYTIFDNDQSSDGDLKQRDANRFLQRVLGVQQEALKDWPSGANSHWAAWDGNMEKYLRSIVGEGAFENAKIQILASFEVSNDDYLKSPTIAAALLTRLVSAGTKFQMLEGIVNAIDKLH
jgi:predicted ATP-dependent endonuclease of OLD family